MIDVRYGHYDFAHPEDEHVRIEIVFPKDMNAPATSYSELWDASADPFDVQIPPSEWVEIFTNKLDGYLYTSKYEQKTKVLEWMTENAAELDSRWAKKRIKNLQRRIDNLTREMSRLQEVVA